MGLRLEVGKWPHAVQCKDTHSLFGGWGVTSADAQVLLLALLIGIYGMFGIKTGHVQGKHPPHNTISLTPESFFFLIIFI